MKRSARVRTVRRSAAIALVLGGLSGCFALFDLDGYGPGPSEVDEAGAIDVVPDRRDASAPDVRYEGSIAFVTSVPIGGRAFNGVANADVFCTFLASDAGLDASFRAFLGDRQTDPANRLVLDGGRIVTRQGQLVAESWSELLTTGPRVAIAETERGVVVVASGTCEDGGAVWTGALPDGGRYPNDDCGRWGLGPTSGNGHAGALGKKGPEWASACDRPCTNPASLLCFQQ